MNMRKRPRKPPAKGKDSDEGLIQFRFDENVGSTTTTSSSVTLTQLSRDGRRIQEEHVSFSAPPSSPPKNASTSGILISSLEADWELGSQAVPGLGIVDLDGELMGEMNWSQDVFSSAEPILVEAPPKAGRYASSDNPFADLKLHVSTFLREMMDLEGRGGWDGWCHKCMGTEDVNYRCRACFGARLLCRTCMVDTHWERPLDRVEKWNGSFFQCQSLKSLGMFVQFGHPPGDPCRSHQKARNRFIVVDVDYIQEVDVRFCMCQPRAIVGEFFQQLLRHSFFPATIAEPHTAFTFRCLEYFHTLTLGGKMTMYDFYTAVESRTDGSGLLGSRDRYDEFVRVVRLWRYLKLLKRGGVGVDRERSLSSISPGELALRCPACPRPGFNLPSNWEAIIREDPQKAYLFYKFISVDACFRLKRRAVSSEQKDPGLFTGAAYFVEQKEYQRLMEEMKTKPPQEEEGHCLGSGLAAIAQANTKFSKGYTQTGCILCICARHEIVEPNGTVDMNKGERYWHTDYAISSSQKHSDSRLLRVLSYDICCQYHKRFFSRVREDLPESIQMEIQEHLWQFVVPKLHIQGHGRPCQERFSLHLLPGAGQTDGEGIERQWASLGPIGTCTKEQGPGHRRETIDDHLGRWNWAKIITLGFLLRKRRLEARIQVRIQTEFFKDFSQSQADNVEEWERMVEAWERRSSDDDGTPNPYSRVDQGVNEQDVRLRYAVEE
ncbi:hypothetical protein V5O48_016532, partial [Marasmius crinis-equi]